MKLAVVGTGKLYNKMKARITRENEIVILADNDKKKWGKKIDGVEVVSPYEITNINFDWALIANINSAKEIKKQLLEIGIEDNKIEYIENYIQIDNTSIESITRFESEYINKSVLFVYYDLKFDGGSMAVWNASRVLSASGYNVTIAVSHAYSFFLEQSLFEKIKIIEIEDIRYIDKRHINWIKNYTYVIANTMWLCKFVIEASSVRKIIWWMHDPSNAYAYNYEVFAKNRSINWENIFVFAVSNLAANNFNKYFSSVDVSILPYCISNNNHKTDLKKILVAKEKVVFLFIGSLIELKGVDVLLESLDKINDNTLQMLEMHIVGKGNTKIEQLVERYINEGKPIKWFGELDRIGVKNELLNADVLICPSREDMLPTVIVEAMQEGIACLMSDAVGMSDYINNNIDGMLFDNESVIQLAEKIEWCIENKHKISEIGEQGKKIYNKYFTEEVFYDNISKILVE